MFDFMDFKSKFSLKFVCKIKNLKCIHNIDNLIIIMKLIFIILIIFITSILAEENCSVSCQNEVNKIKDECSVKCVNFYDAKCECKLGKAVCTCGNDNERGLSTSNLKVDNS